MDDQRQSKWEILEKKDPLLALQLLNEKSWDEKFSQIDNDLYSDPNSPELGLAEGWFLSWYAAADSKLLFNWLSQNILHRIIVVFNDYAQISLWLLQVDSEIVAHPQLQLMVCSTNKDKLSKEINQRVWTFPSFNIGFYDPKGEFSPLIPLVETYNYKRQAAVAEIMQYGRSNWPNIIKRLERLEEEKAFSLDYKWQDIPVVICAAGPSIERQKTDLKKFKDHFFIISAGTGANVLEAMGLEPHLAMLIDPFRAQFSRFILLNNPLIAHAAGWRTNRHALQHLSGPSILLPAANAYPMTQDWWLKLGHDPLTIDEGHNVVAAAIDCCKQLQSPQICLLGVDLAFEQNHLYAAKVNSSEQFWMLSSQEEQILQAPGVNGSQVSTLAKWLLEADWLSQAANSAENSALDAQLVRVTDGGLHIAMKTISSLDEIANEWPQRDYQAWSWCWQAQLKPADPHGSSKSILSEWIKSLELDHQSLEHSAAQLADWLQQLDLDLSKGPNHQQASACLEDKRIELYSDIEQKLSALRLYQPLWQLWSQCFKRVFYTCFETIPRLRLSYLDLWLLYQQHLFLLKGNQQLIEFATSAHLNNFFACNEV